jgi:hypothetical protein
MTRANPFGSSDPVSLRIQFPRPETREHRRFRLIRYESPRAVAQPCLAVFRVSFLPLVERPPGQTEVSARSGDFSSRLDLRDIRMVQRREDLRFSPESSDDGRQGRTDEWVDRADGRGGRSRIETLPGPLGRPSGHEIPSSLLLSNEVAIETLEIAHEGIEKA